MASLDGVRALVTGSTSGLGLAMASALAAAGASVVVTGRSAERAAEVAERLGAACFGLAMDVRSAEAVASGVDAAWSRLGGVAPPAQQPRIRLAARQPPLPPGAPALL